MLRKELKRKIVRARKKEERCVWNYGNPYHDVS
jgi:hypothetical protein